jgi:hypothetical protein
MPFPDEASELPTSTRIWPSCASASARRCESQQGQQQELPRLEQQRRQVLADVQQAQKERAEANARRSALQQLQQRLQSNGKLDDWLRRHRLAARRTAVEVAARRSRLGGCGRSSVARASGRLPAGAPTRRGAATGRAAN